MNLLRSMFERIDQPLTNWMAANGVALLRISLGVIFLWFGALKFFPGLSAAESLATRTIGVLSFGLISADAARLILAVWESLIGIGLLSGRYLRIVLLLLWVQMLGTVTPILIFPHEVFAIFPYAPTLEGQYIFKNLVLISAGIVIGGTVRGGRLIPEPESG